MKNFVEIGNLKLVINAHFHLSSQRLKFFCKHLRSFNVHLALNFHKRDEPLNALAFRAIISQKLVKRIIVSGDNCFEVMAESIMARKFNQ